MPIADYHKSNKCCGGKKGDCHKSEMGFCWYYLVDKYCGILHLDSSPYGSTTAQDVRTAGSFAAHAFVPGYSC